MLKNRLIVILAAGVALVLVAGFAIRTNIAASTGVPEAGAVSNPAARQPAGAIPLAAMEASDYFQRHPEVLQPGNTLDVSDYYQRHPSSTVITTAGASDWFERHPELVSTGSALDMTDWFQRHYGGNRQHYDAINR